MEFPSGRTYLVDTTVNQFTAAVPEGMARAPGVVGQSMRSTGEGRSYLQALESNGFIELTDDVASWYGSSFRGGDSSVTPQSFLRNTGDLEGGRADWPEDSAEFFENRVSNP